jgi:hypothetical protein
MSEISDIDAINKLLKSNPQMMKELLANNPTFRENVEKIKIEHAGSIEVSIRKIKATNKMDYSPLQLDYMKNLPNSDDFIDSLDISENVNCDIKRMISRLNEPDIQSAYHPMMFAILQENEFYINIHKRTTKGRSMIDLLNKQ